MTPHSPETGFGYIERGRRLTDAGENEAFRAKNFWEKPPLYRARKYTASGKHYWNSGIFISQAARLIDELEAHQSRLSEVLSRAATAYEKRDAASFAKFWVKCESISIDHAVMEKTRNLIVLPADVGWSDLGTWPALRGVLPRDEAGNVWMLPKGGETESIDAKNLIVRSNKKFVAAIGGRGRHHHRDGRCAPHLLDCGCGKNRRDGQKPWAWRRQISMIRLLET